MEWLGHGTYPSIKGNIKQDMYTHNSDTDIFGAFLGLVQWSICPRICPTTVVTVFPLCETSRNRRTRHDSLVVWHILWSKKQDDDPISFALFGPVWGA